MHLVIRSYFATDDWLISPGTKEQVVRSPTYHKTLESLKRSIYKGDTESRKFVSLRQVGNGIRVHYRLNTSINWVQEMSLMPTITEGE